MSNSEIEERAVTLHGKRRDHLLLADEGYQSPPEYESQGEKRVIKDLTFAYTIVDKAPDGSDIIVGTEVPRDTEVTIEEIGLLALRKGEQNRSFYTSDELERIRLEGSPVAPVAATADISAMGEFELSEWLETNNPSTGRPWTINDVLEKVGEDKDLAHRMLQAENTRTNGDPRAGLEQGLTAIIQG